jgi:hypothetical protein
MTNDPLKPWSLAPVVTVLLVMFVLFMSGIGVLTLVATPSIKATAATKALIVVGVASGIGGAISTIMWSHYWRQVQWEVGFWEFVSGPAPEYEEALLAWRWGRRFRLCWIVTIFTMGAIVLAEVVAGHW